MKNFISIAFLVVIISVGLSVLFYVGVAKVGTNVYNEASEPLKNFVGDTVVINKDTLIITDYSTWNNTLKLNNGTEVDIEFVKKLKK